MLITAFHAWHGQPRAGGSPRGARPGEGRSRSREADARAPRAGRGHDAQDGGQDPAEAREVGAQVARPVRGGRPRSPPRPPPLGAPAGRPAQAPRMDNGEDIPRAHDARDGALGDRGLIGGRVPHARREEGDARGRAFAQGGAPRPREQGGEARGALVAAAPEGKDLPPEAPRVHRAGAGRGHLCARRRGGNKVLIPGGRASRRHVHGQPPPRGRVRRAGGGREAPLPDAREVQRRHVRVVPAGAPQQVRQDRSHRGQGSAAPRQEGQGLFARLRRRGGAGWAPRGVAVPERRRGGVAPRKAGAPAPGAPRDRRRLPARDRELLQRREVEAGHPRLPC